MQTPASANRQGFFNGSEGRSDSPGSRQPVLIDHRPQGRLIFAPARCKQVGVPAAHEREERAEVGFCGRKARRVVLLCRPNEPLAKHRCPGSVAPGEGCFASHVDAVKAYSIFLSSVGQPEAMISGGPWSGEPPLSLFRGAVLARKQAVHEECTDRHKLLETNMRTRVQFPPAGAITFKGVH